jgi:plasmid stabilization system protein ParE
MQILREFQEEDTEKRQLNLRLSVTSLSALEKIADHYEDNRTAVATLLLQAAIADVCEHLGIDWKLYDEKGNPVGSPVDE